MSRFSKLLKQAFSSYPLVTNSLVYGALYVGAEFSQQTLAKKIMTEQPKPLDTAALTRYGIYGTTIQGPLLTTWYRWLDKHYVGTSIKIVTKKLLLDQFLLTPPLLVIFYVAMSIMESKTDLLEECKQKIIPTFQTSCLFWLPAQAVNFLLIPPSYRVVYVGSCALAWVNILCWFKRQAY